MSTATDGDARLPTTGPAPGTFERYREMRTADGDVIIYDEGQENAWIQAASALPLEAWR